MQRAYDVRSQIQAVVEAGFSALSAFEAGFAFEAALTLEGGLALAEAGFAFPDAALAAEAGFALLEAGLAAAFALGLEAGFLASPVTACTVYISGAIAR